MEETAQWTWLGPEMPARRGEREKTREGEKERRREGEREYVLVSRAHNSHRERVRESRIGYAHVQSQGEG